MSEDKAKVAKPKSTKIVGHKKAKRLTKKEKKAAGIKNPIQARHDFARISPRKARLVADMIRGKNVDEALLILKYNIKRGSAFVDKVVKSAIANAQVLNIDTDNLKVSKIYVEGGPIIKRWSPRAMGRATPINKRTSHICVELS